jgi:hypothetical protein
VPSILSEEEVLDVVRGYFFASLNPNFRVEVEKK